MIFTLFASQLFLYALNNKWKRFKRREIVRINLYNEQQWSFYDRGEWGNGEHLSQSKINQTMKQLF